MACVMLEQLSIHFSGQCRHSEQSFGHIALRTAGARFQNDMSYHLLTEQVTDQSEERICIAEFPNIMETQRFLHTAIY